MNIYRFFSSVLLVGVISAAPAPPPPETALSSQERGLGGEAWWAAVQEKIRSGDGTDGLSETPDWTAESDQESAYFGYSVGTAGDVNGDGFADVIVGASSYDNGQFREGRALVYHGSASGLSSIPDWTAEGDQDYAEFGKSVGTAGDVNGDGYADVIIGASEYDNGQAGEGRAYVYHGSASGLSTSADWTAESDLRMLASRRGRSGPRRER